MTRNEGFKLGLRGLATAAVFLVAGPLAGVIAAPLVLVRPDMTILAIVAMIVVFPFTVIFAYVLGGLAALAAGVVAATVSLITPRWWLYVPGCGLIAVASGAVVFEEMIGLPLAKFLVLCAIAGLTCGA